MSSSKSFFLATMLSCTVGVGIVGLLNWLVDPHDYFGNNKTAVYVDNDRYLKRRIAESVPHDALLIGSSKIAAINPDDILGHTYINAGMVSITPEEILHFLRQHGQGMKLIIIGFDFFMFNKTPNPMRIDSDASPLSVGPWYVYTFSASIAIESIQNLTNWLRDAPPTVLENGQRNQLQRIKSDQIFHGPAYDKALWHLQKSEYAGFDYADERVPILEAIRQWSDDNNVPMTVIINPLNIAVRQLITKLDLDPMLEKFRHDVRDVFPEVIDHIDTEWSDPRFFYWSDPWHFRPEAGAAIINEALGHRSGS